MNNESTITEKDLLYFRDVSEIIKARNIYFTPFFGAFIAFLVAKNEYISGAGWVIQIELIMTFLFGVSYAYTVSSFLSKLEGLRVMLCMKMSPFFGPELHFTAGEWASIDATMRTIGPAIRFESRLFRWVMRLLWLTTVSVMLDLYFGSTLRFWTAKLAVWIVAF